MARVEITQSYYTNAQASLYDPNYSTSNTFARPSNFSPIGMNVRVSPTTNLNARVSAEIDSDALELRSLNTNAGYRWTRGSADVGWSQTFFIASVQGLNNPDFLRRDLTFATNLRTVDNRFGGNYQVAFDAANTDVRNQTVSGYYNAQCCGFAVQYQRYNFGSSLAPINSDRRFFISVSLAGLGSFSPFNGALSGIPR
jgi:hypothetical protein